MKKRRQSRPRRGSASGSGQPRWAGLRVVEHRSSSEGADSPVPLDLLGLSVGIEDPDDLIADVEATLSG
jgi:hypothetical protein